MNRYKLLGFAAILPVSFVLATVGQAAQEPQPHGPSGNYRLVWHDEFSSNAIDHTKWTELDWRLQNVTMSPGNAWAYNGKLVLRLSSKTSGGAVRSTFNLKPGMIVEARIKFPGSDASENHIYNFPAWWASGPYVDGEALAGENDIAEGLGKPSNLKISYWDRHKTRLFSVRPPGDWNNAYHNFTLRRGVGWAAVWYDSKLVAKYSTNDSGGSERLFLSLGSSSWFHPVLGKPGLVRVDYVRVWVPR